MINVTIQVNGLDKVKKKFTVIPKQVGAAISRAVKESGFILEKEAKEAITTGPTRALRTGTLRSQNVVREMSDVRVSLYPLVHYAIPVHEGTARMRARPWLTVAAKNAKGEVQRVFDDAIHDILKA